MINGCIWSIKPISLLKKALHFSKKDPCFYREDYSKKVSFSTDIFGPVIITRYQTYKNPYVLFFLIIQVLFFICGNDPGGRYSICNSNSQHAACLLYTKPCTYELRSHITRFRFKRCPWSTWGWWLTDLLCVLILTYV